MGHVFVRARFRGKSLLEVDKMLVDTGSSSTVMPLMWLRNTLLKHPLKPS